MRIIMHCLCYTGGDARVMLLSRPIPSAVSMAQVWDSSITLAWPKKAEIQMSDVFIGLLDEEIV